MRRCATVLFIAALVAVPLFGGDPPLEPSSAPPEMNPALFCEGRYALCIKAPCRPVVTRGTNGAYTIAEANCSCDVEVGWSMGPLSCDERKPVNQNGRMYLISSYSNLFNKSDLTLTCESESTLWAWCYGSPCAVDEKDSSKAICTCPVKTGKAQTLGGGCRTAACRDIWSAATTAGNAFANDYFYKYMKEHKLQPPPNPPARDCPASQK